MSAFDVLFRKPSIRIVGTFQRLGATCKYFSIPKDPVQCRRFFPVLYKRNSHGKLLSWVIWVVDDGYTTQSGIVGGAIKSYPITTCTPKNVGRSNATTSEDQALSEAYGKWLNKRDREGYTETRPPAESTVDTLITQRPMLAVEYVESRLKKACDAEGKVGLSIKLDGIRCVAYWNNGEIVLRSRSNTVYTYLNRIREYLRLHLPKRAVLDGEIYVHDIPFNDISGTTRAKISPSEFDSRMELHVFDIFIKDKPDLSYRQRIAMLKNELIKWASVDEKTDPPVVFIGYETAECHQDIVNANDKFVGMGYEGVMIRNLESPYQWGKRNACLMKFKDCVDTEFTVVDVIEASGNEKGKALFVVQVGDKTMTVRPKGTHQRRAWQLEHKEMFIGKKLTVRHQKIDEDVLPRFPRGIKFSDDIEKAVSKGVKLLDAVGIDIRDYE